MQDSSGRLYDFVSIVMVGFTALAVIVIVLLFLNPNAGFNPFPPDDSADEGGGGPGPLPTLVEITPATQTPPPPTLPPSWTPSPSSTGGPTITTSPTTTITSTPTSTTTKVPTPTRTFTPTPTGPTPVPTSQFPYILQSGTPRQTSYFANPSVGCDWAGLGGQVLDQNGIGVIGVTVHVFGSGVDRKVTSGSNTDYGSGGWEVNVHITPVVRNFTVRIENAVGDALSSDVDVQTGDSCSTNLTVVNFVRLP